jgi:hypothetical protein
MNQNKTKPRATQNQQTGIYKPDAVKVGRALLDVEAKFTRLARMLPSRWVSQSQTLSLQY